MKSLKKQIKGNHYLKFKIQPAEFINKNGLLWAEGNVIKYVCRWKDKNGIEDVRKAIHYLELLIEYEELE